MLYLRVFAVLSNTEDELYKEDVLGHLGHDEFAGEVGNGESA